MSPSPEGPGSSPPAPDATAAPGAVAAAAPDATAAAAPDAVATAAPGAVAAATVGSVADAAAAAGAGPAAPAPQPSVVDALRAASEGLLLPSESDAPFSVVALGEAPTEASLRAASGQPDDAAVTTQTLDALLGALGVERPSHDEAERAEAARFRALSALITARLADVAVFRVGSVDVDVWIVGREGDRWVALQSHVVET